jgi:hypothetical protein
MDIYGEGWKRSVGQIMWEMKMYYPRRVKEQRNILHEIRKRKANWFGHILRRNCLLQRVTEGKIQGGIEVTGRQGRKRRKLFDDLKERRGYSHLKEEALDRTTWRARFGRGFGPVVRQTTKWMMNNGRILLPSHGAHEWNEWQNVVIMNVKNGEVNGWSYEHLLKQCCVTELHTKFAASPCGNARTSMHTHKHRHTTSKQELVTTSFKQI